MKNNSQPEQTERDTDEEFNKLRENDTIVEETIVTTSIKTPAKKAVKKKAVCIINVNVTLFFL